jgi:2-polyprenyl-6-methoxyphenol hydroxylase-like FAD-dependent oxidoreductase
MPLEVLVAGAGLGGLCLAQGLVRAGVQVRVLERDTTPHARGQGYRLRIDSDGVAALRRCLPDDLFQLFCATTNPPYSPRGVVYDHHLAQLASFGDAVHVTERLRLSAIANRQTLRQILLAGLDGTVEFGREVIGVGEDGERVEAWLADGSVVTGDVLIGADGINSAVRAQRLPHAELCDTGLRGIYGRAILDTDLRNVLPDRLCVGSPAVVGPDGVTLSMGVYQPSEPPQRAAARLAPYARLAHVADYLKWTLIAPPESLGLTERSVWAASPETLYQIVRRVTSDWHPVLAELVRCADPSSVFALSIRAALPVDPWPTTRITLLGDAIHATTPAGGTGANVALRDAALLTEQLTAVDRGRADLLDAIGGYEQQLRAYGFAASTRSLRSAEQIFRARLSVLV